MITTPILVRPTLAALLGSLALASAQTKTITPERVRDNLLDQAPFRHNGALISGESRGSAFHAWHPNTIFTAAHVVFQDNVWTPPPVWYPKANAASLDAVPSIQTRGYVRWNDYARFATEVPGNSRFSKDMAVAFAFRRLADGSPARIDTGGARTLNSGGSFTITGYPAENQYINQSIEGYFLHRTKPFRAEFRPLSGRALIAPLITTGPGNSGGPVWVRNDSNQWVAGGILTGGLPSETVVFGFTPEINPLLRAVEPMVSSPARFTNGVPGVSASSMFFPYQKRRIIPDGVPRWTAFTVGVGAFDNEATVNSLKLNLDIRTAHRGDLQVSLSAPNGTNVLVHNEQGADAENLVFKNKVLTGFFSGTIANGPWTLRVQDRLKGDICELRSFRLEIGVNEVTDGGSGGGTSE